MPEKERKILIGPWKGTPPLRDEELFSDTQESIDIPVSDFRAIAVPVAPCREFLFIVASARSGDILKSKISDEIKRYGRWSRAQLLLFVNNPQNHPILIQKPALVLALHALIELRR
jgi:hypothetical protein